MIRVSTSCAWGSGAVTLRMGSLGKKNGSLRHRVHVPGKPEFFQGIHKIFSEKSAVPHPLQILGGDLQILQVVQNLLKTRGQQEPAFDRKLADIKFKHGGVVHVLIEIALHHGELIKVSA